MSRLLIVRDAMDGGPWYYDLGLDEWTSDARRASEFHDTTATGRVIAARGLGTTAKVLEARNDED